MTDFDDLFREYQLAYANECACQSDEECDKATEHWAKLFFRIVGTPAPEYRHIDNKLAVLRDAARTDWTDARLQLLIQSIREDVANHAAA